MIARLLAVAGLLLVGATAGIAQQQAPPSARENPEPAPPPPAPAEPGADKLRAVEAKLREEIHRRALAAGERVRTDQGETKNYVSMPVPRALSICVFWDDATPETVPVGAFGAAWGRADSPTRAVEICNRFKARAGATRCDCTLADVDGANRVAVPEAVTLRVARATP